MPFARYIELRLKGRIHGSQTINVFHFGTDAAAADDAALVALLAQLCVAVIECSVQQLLPAVTEDWFLEGADAKQLFPAVSDPIEVQAAAGSIGTRQAVNTSFESVLMRILTGGGGKRGRGRKFLPPPGDADITQSVLTAGDAANFFAGFIACLVGKFIGAGATTAFRLGVLSQRHLQLTPNDYNGAFRAATQLTIETKITGLRSRKLGVGA
jgi:hypothetical protein